MMIFNFLRMQQMNKKMKKIQNNNMIIVVDINLYVYLQKVILFKNYKSK